MRISTNILFSNPTTQLNTLQGQLARTQQQLSSGHRMLSAADDPIAAARVLEVTQSQSINAQFATNRQNARTALSQEEVALTSVQNLVQDVQQTVVAAGNGANTPSDRKTYADVLQGRYDDLLALANSSDGNGGYLFSGYKSGTQPFVQSSAGVTYQGDQGQAQLQVGGARQVAINDPGSAIFEGLPTGNGTFATSATGANTGSGVISAGTMPDPRLATGHSYNIAFSAPAGGPTTFVVTDATTGATVPAAPADPTRAFTSGGQIDVDGMRFDISGAPADGDSFAVQPSQKQSMFAALGSLIAALRAPATDPVSQKALKDSLAQAGSDFGASLDNVLTVRSSLGARMKELDTLDDAGQSADLQYATTLSKLSDLDYNKAISEFTQQQTNLEAAQKTFKAISGLSLFNFIG
jgi:flagellar hook-associated protein 3 FlgL